MSDVHIIYALTGEARGDLLAFLLNIEDKWQKPFDIRWRYIISVGALYEGFAFQVENGHQARHVNHKRYVKGRHTAVIQIWYLS